MTLFKYGIAPNCKQKYCYLLWKTDDQVHVFMKSSWNMLYLVPAHGSRIRTCPASSRPSTTTQCPILPPRSKSIADHEPVLFKRSKEPGSTIAPVQGRED